MTLRIIFMGTADFACSGLRALGQSPDFNVAAVVTQPDRPRGRHLKPQPSPVKTVALEKNLPVLQPERAREENFIRQLRDLQPDLIVVAAYGQILPAGILELPRHGCVNVHASLLPKYRGASPIQSAILNDEAETGVTIMKMDAGLDTGPILTQTKTPIRADDNSQTLHDRLAQMGAELLVQTIPDYVAGKIQPRPQPVEGVSYAPKIKKQDGLLDWNLTARQLWNRIRAFTPWPGAFTHLKGDESVQESTANRISSPSPRDEGAGRGGSEEAKLKASSLRPCPPSCGGEGGDKSDHGSPHLLKIWQAEVVEQSGAAGEILSADKSGIIIACGQNALRISSLQLEGGRRLTAQEFLAGHGLKAGQKLG
jgi:methionyl-tRNA formyltransferase